MSSRITQRTISDIVIDWKGLLHTIASRKGTYRQGTFGLFQRKSAVLSFSESEGPELCTVLELNSSALAERAAT